MAHHGWMNLSDGAALAFNCAWCGRQVGAGGQYQRTGHVDSVLICNHCGARTILWSGMVVPQSPFGEAVDNVPPDTLKVYDEARRCTSVGAYTGAALLCRKALMHVAESLGAEGNQTFEQLGLGRGAGAGAGVLPPPPCPGHGHGRLSQ